MSEELDDLLSFVKELVETATNEAPDTEYRAGYLDFGSQVLEYAEEEGMEDDVEGR